MLCCSAAFAADTDIAILVPNADHGCTGAVMTYAEEKAAAVNAEGTYTAQVITSADSWPTRSPRSKTSSKTRAPTPSSSCRRTTPSR